MIRSTINHDWKANLKLLESERETLAYRDGANSGFAWGVGFAIVVFALAALAFNVLSRDEPVRTWPTDGPVQESRP